METPLPGLGGLETDSSPVSTGGGGTEAAWGQAKGFRSWGQQVWGLSSTLPPHGGGVRLGSKAICSEGWGASHDCVWLGHTPLAH